jgi:hypothetical protein
MIYRHLEDGNHQLSITGPELADIAELVASLARSGGDARLIAFKLFHALDFQKVVEQRIKSSAEI